MQPTSYANQLRQLRNAEKAFNKDFTDRAVVVYDLRVQTIMDTPMTDEQRQRQLDAALQQYKSFMGREFQRPEAEPSDIPF